MTSSAPEQWPFGDDALEAENYPLDPPGALDAD